MKKKIVTVCFLLSLLAKSSLADVRPITAAEATMDYNQEPKMTVNPADLPDPNNQEEVRAFFKKRFEEAAYMETEKPLDTSPSAIDVQHSAEYYARQREKNKPLFQKMYEQALASLHKDEKKDNPEQEDIEEYEEAVETATRFFSFVEHAQAAPEPQIPTVSVSLPSGRRILAPAREHIPYLLSYIDIQANGFVKVEDTMIIVANGRKFAQGLTRVFPKYAKPSQKIELILDKVTVNGTEVPYMAEEIGTTIVIKPKYNQKLEPGVYSYKFSYLISNQLFEIPNDRFFFRWNLTGVPLNVFITSANTIVSVPEGHTFDMMQAVIGEKKDFNTRRVNQYRLAGNTIAFSSNTPLLNRESMQLIGVLNKDVFLPNFNKNFSYFLINWGNILYASIGFFAIFISFLLSLITLKKSKNNSKFNPSYNGALMRTVLIGKYDRIAFIAQILDLCRKGYLNITEENNRFFLHRMNASNTKISAYEKKAVSAMFGKKSDVTEINNASTNLLKRAHKILEKAVNKQVRKYKLIHNIGYLIFSVLMLLLTNIFIAFISVNIAQSLIILLTTSVLYAFYIWILTHKFKHWFTTIPMKVIAMLSIAIIWIFSSIYIGGITSAIIAATVLIIFLFVRIFAEQNNFINEAKEIISNYKEYLISNAESINLSRNFINQQSNVFALGISEYFPQNVSNQGSYKLDMAEGIKRALVGIV